MTLPNPVDYAVPGFVVLVLLEMIYARLTGRAQFETRDSAASLLMGLGSTMAGIFAAGIVGATFGIVMDLRLGAFGWSVPLFILCFVADDLAYYCFHRAAHRIRWFWASHVVHHSSQYYNLTTA